MQYMYYQLILIILIYCGEVVNQNRKKWLLAFFPLLALDYEVSSDTEQKQRMLKEEKKCEKKHKCGLHW